MHKFEAKDTAFRRNHVFRLGGRSLIKTGPMLMGILNITPDSFFSGSRITNEKILLEKVGLMLEQGADILDLGAVSTRPGASDLGPEEEYSRLIPAIKLVVSHFPEAFLSVDTWRAEIAREAIEAGAFMINDISGGSFDEEMVEFIAEKNVPYVMMHTTGRPSEMQNKALEAGEVLEAVNHFFRQQIDLFSQKGAKQLITDPGFGFGKTLDANFAMLGCLQELRLENYPQLVGLSRKSMIYKLLDETPVTALNGTTSLNTIALLNGADILRVHDIKEAKEVVELTSRLAQTLSMLRR